MHSHWSVDVFHEVTARWKISSRRCLEDQWPTAWLYGSSLSWGSRVLSHSYFQSTEFVILFDSPATLYICICQEKSILSSDVFLRHMSRARKEDTIRVKRYGGSQRARYATINTRKQGRYRKSTFPGTLCWWPFTSGLQLAFNLNLIIVRNLAHQPDPLPSWA